MKIVLSYMFLDQISNVQVDFGGIVLDLCTTLQETSTKFLCFDFNPSDIF